jgi:hypothetical protein
MLVQLQNEKTFAEGIYSIKQYLKKKVPLFVEWTDKDVGKHLSVRSEEKESNNKNRETIICLQLYYYFRELNNVNTNVCV